MNDTIVDKKSFIYDLEDKKKGTVLDDGTFVWGKTGKTEKLIREPSELASVENPALVNLVTIKVCV